jgi:threonine/homoserine/homoserine lactone efflux protein
MFDASTLVLFLASTLALNVSPGPDVLFVLANSAQHGTRGGILATLGVSTGLVIHTVAATVGLAALLAATPWALNVVRIGGAAYLLWLGISAWRSAGIAPEATVPADAWAILRRGFVTNVLNPKVALFFLAFLPQFADPKRGAVAAQVAVLGALFIASGTVVNFLYALAGGWLSERLRRNPLWQERLTRVSGSVLLLLGLRLLYPQKAS